MWKKKGQLISERIKIPLVAAFGSPLVKALDKSVETLGLWIVTSRLHSLLLLITPAWALNWKESGERLAITTMKALPKF